MIYIRNRVEIQMEKIVIWAKKDCLIELENTVSRVVKIKTKVQDEWKWKADVWGVYGHLVIQGSK